MPKVAFSHFDNCFICFDISLGLISLLIFTDTVLYEGKTIWILCDHRMDGWGITLLWTYKKHSCHVFRTTLTERATYSFLTFHLRHNIGWSGQVFYHVSMLCLHLLNISYRHWMGTYDRVLEWTIQGHIWVALALLLCLALQMSSSAVA